MVNVCCRKKRIKEVLGLLLRELSKVQLEASTYKVTGYGGI
jgi:hypothetical protein